MTKNFFLKSFPLLIIRLKMKFWAKLHKALGSKASINRISILDYLYEKYAK